MKSDFTFCTPTYIKKSKLCFCRIEALYTRCLLTQTILKILAFTMNYGVGRNNDSNVNLFRISRFVNAAYIELPKSVSSV